MKLRARSLANRSIDAMLAAVEVYNKPNFAYRDESFAILAINAWELLLKARIVQHSDNKMSVILNYQKRRKADGESRILDEFGEDMIFVSEAIRTGQVTELQQRFIDEFFQREFDSSDPLLATQKRHRVLRDRIQAAIARFNHHPVNPSDAQAVSRTISKGYSGYVHGASERILEMYDGTRYRLNGMLGTPRQLEFEDGIWDYFHGSLTTLMYACLAFDEQGVLDDLDEFRARYEEAWGCTDCASPAKAVE